MHDDFPLIWELIDDITVIVLLISSKHTLIGKEFWHFVHTGWMRHVRDVITHVGKADTIVKNAKKNWDHPNAKKWMMSGERE